MEKKYLGLIVRCCGEYWMEEFCSYYLSQGVDEIHIINDGAPEKFYDNLKNNESVHIEHVKGTFDRVPNGQLHTKQMRFVNRHYGGIRGRFEWMIVCDADEFITTRKNINRTIREELKETFEPNNVDIILVPWVIMSCGGRKKSPKSILKGITKRWNHDKRHAMRGPRHRKFTCHYKGIPIKSIFRTSAARRMGGPHKPRPIPGTKCVDSINIKPFTVANNVRGEEYTLREEDIKNGYLLCYHYRTISDEYCEQKLKDSQLYRLKGVTKGQIMSFDFPEVCDETLKRKITDSKDYFTK